MVEEQEEVVEDGEEVGENRKDEEIVHKQDYTMKVDDAEELGSPGDDAEDSPVVPDRPDVVGVDGDHHYHYDVHLDTEGVGMMEVMEEMEVMEVTEVMEGIEMVEGMEGGRVGRVTVQKNAQNQGPE